MYQKLEIYEQLQHSDMIPVEGYKGLYRDEDSNAIVNCNENEYDEYLHIKNTKILEKKEIDRLKSEVNDLKILVENLIKSTNK